MVLRKIDYEKDIEQKFGCFGHRITNPASLYSEVRGLVPVRCTLDLQLDYNNRRNATMIALTYILLRLLMPIKQQFSKKLKIKKILKRLSKLCFIEKLIPETKYEVNQ